MVGEVRGEHESDWAAMARVAELLGVWAAETVGKWCRQAEVAPVLVRACPRRTRRSSSG